MKWPNTTDGQIWAREWLATPNHMEQADDEGAMIGWFANAIMAGWDTACQNHEENVKHLEGRIKFWEESYELSRKQLSEMVRWRSPKNPPKIYTEVLVLASGIVGVGKYMGYGDWTHPNYPVLGQCKPTGWLPIPRHE